MPRKAKTTKRERKTDPRYHSDIVDRLINRIMSRGKKSTAERIVYQALDIIAKQTKENPVSTLEQAVQNATPLLKTTPCRWRNIPGSH
jgi:small subunit ribosomal protein S7